MPLLCGYGHVGLRKYNSRDRTWVSKDQTMKTANLALHKKLTGIWGFRKGKEDKEGPRIIIGTCHSSPNDEQEKYQRWG